MNYSFPSQSCAACTWHKAPIPGDGPDPCDIMAIGEGPAYWEVKRRRFFVGKTGQELDNQYLPLAGLTRASVYVTNVTHCPFPDFRNPTPQEAAQCALKHLPGELYRVHPQVILALGAVACSVFDVADGGKLGKVDLELQHGIPLRAEYGLHWEGWLVPMYHPAAGLHEGVFMIPLREDFKRLKGHLGKLLNGELPDLPADPWEFLEEPHYEEICGAEKLHRIRYLLSGCSECCKFAAGPAVDTESDLSRPFSIQFSYLGGTGYFIDASDPELVREFAEWVHQTRPLLILHNAVHDLEVFYKLDIRPARYLDTMLWARDLQTLPQGLKPLAYRLCGMRMQSWDDLVTPWSLAAVRRYAQGFCEVFEAGYQFQHILKSGLRKGEAENRFLKSTPKLEKGTYNKFMSLLRSLDSGQEEEGEPANPWQRWDGWKDQDLELAQVLMGEPMPRKTIAHVPRDKAVWYGCRDADATGRVYQKLRPMGFDLS